MAVLFLIPAEIRKCFWDLTSYYPADLFEET